MLRLGSRLTDETSLGAAYGSMCRICKAFSDAMSYVHVTELEYNDKRMLVRRGILNSL